MTPHGEGVKDFYVDRKLACRDLVKSTKQKVSSKVIMFPAS